ncbi:MAG: CRISPR-associated endonuclease Cas1 [Deltaproteobacteria bacterium]|nr:CRISPR-associated endonuclease Cas1 [Deltaproteobacteria bacterium]
MSEQNTLPFFKGEPEGILSREAHMVVYIRTQGARIIKEGRHLLVKKGDATYHTLFTYKLRQIVIFGNVDITHFAFV